MPKVSGCPEKAPPIFAAYAAQQVLKFYARLQAGKGGKAVSDQWLDPFVIVDEEDQPVGTVQVRHRQLFSINTCCTDTLGDPSVCRNCNLCKYSGRS